MNFQALQAYLRNSLGASAGLKSIVGTRIYDRVPPLSPDQLFPYVRLGPVNGVNVSVGCWEAWEVVAQVDCYSRAVGVVEAKRMLDEVCRALDDLAPLIPTVRCALFVLHNADCRSEQDGITTHAFANFRSIYGPL